MGAGSSGHVSAFEGIRQTDADGYEYWSARDLSKVLGYARWENFATAIERAKAACENSAQAIEDHFRDATKMIEVGKGGRREVEDVHLSRYACYLIVQNADPSKEIVALGQTYFAVQTRRAELDATLADMSEAQKRLFLRDQIAERNTQLAAAASEAGVVTPRDFAIFQDHGYMGLYGGERAHDIAARKGLAKGQQILDYMGFSELAANMFRVAQTEEKLRREEIEGKAAANSAHFTVGRAVRKTIEELGGTLPEELPMPPQSIQQIRRSEQQRIAQQGQLSLFGEMEGDEQP